MLVGCLSQIVVPQSSTAVTLGIINLLKKCVISCKRTDGGGEGIVCAEDQP